ncbi:MAG: SsrA-binding protein SmpB [Holosporales bacterium]|jgi:SsrA-binding protein|nr:SsrA-binding protein SmpB [Holosporales bacterium]
MQKKIVVQNRRAKFNYIIEETFEAGLILHGSEVKSLRTGKASIQESYASEEQDGDIYLINSTIQEYPHSLFNHEPKRSRKLLLKRKQINKLLGKIKRSGYTLIPLSIYFNERNLAKLELALAKGKSNVDKRETLKKRDWQRDKERIMSNYNKRG